MYPDSVYQPRKHFGIVPIVIIIVLALAGIGLGIFGGWSYSNYLDQKNNVDQKVQKAVSDAKRAQNDTDEAEFAEREKEPTKQFVGPDDLGRVTFQFPKTWSGYVDKLGVGSNYEAYFQPGVVAPVSGSTPYALRITIENKSYESSLSAYQEKVKKGDIKSSATTVGGVTGNKLEGKIETNVEGIMVLLKLRDKTLKVYTESLTFRTDFENTILPSLTFNQ